MHIYFSGIGGVGIGPLAEVALDAGYEVSGSDLGESEMTRALTARGVSVHINQDGSALAAAQADLFVYTAALPTDHPELLYAKEHGIPVVKRDELLARIIREHNLKLIAVAGTHGKTTTSGLLVWTLKQLGIPVSYLVGTSLSFGPSGHYDPNSEYFVYECDEYDRNFLHFYPHLSLIPAIDYDHPDTYPSRREYQDAFVDFLRQSDYSLLWEKDVQALETASIDANYEAYDEHMDLSHLSLPGDHVRHNAFLVERAVQRLQLDAISMANDHLTHDTQKSLVDAINAFPGTGRRFEKLADNLYSDYGHHPAEIKATLQMARELSDHVVLVYQPHQNVRQHEIQNDYTNCMEQAEEIYWLPTYLSREDPNLRVLTASELSAKLSNSSSVHVAEMNDELWRTIETARASGKLVLVMGAGSVDGWIRQRLATTK